MIVDDAGGAEPASNEVGLLPSRSAEWHDTGEDEEKHNAWRDDQQEQVVAARDALLGIGGRGRRVERCLGGEDVGEHGARDRTRGDERATRKQDVRARENV